MKPTIAKCHLHEQGFKEEYIAFKVEIFESGKVCCKNKRKDPMRWDVTHGVVNPSLSASMGIQ